MASDNVATMADSPRFEVTPYRPDGGNSFWGTLHMALVLAIGGMILGWLAGWISQYIWLVLIFPLLMGLLLGGIGAKCVRFCHVRDPRACGLIGFAAGILAMLTMHYYDYASLRTTIRQEFGEFEQAAREVARNIDELEANLDQQPEDVQIFIQELRGNEELLRVLQVNSLPAYLDHMAHVGVQLKGKRGQGNTNLGYYGSYIYWAAEIVLFSAVVYVLMSIAASAPYCVDCGLWKESESWGRFDHAQGIAARFAEGEIQPLLSGELSTPPDANLEIFTCSECQPEGTIDIKITQTQANKKGEEVSKEVGFFTFPGEALPALESARESGIAWAQSRFEDIDVDGIPLPKLPDENSTT